MHACKQQSMVRGCQQDKKEGRRSKVEDKKREKKRAHTVLILVGGFVPSRHEPPKVHAPFRPHKPPLTTGPVCTMPLILVMMESLGACLTGQVNEARKRGGRSGDRPGSSRLREWSDNTRVLLSARLVSSRVRGGCNQ
jgi:hypothetical protein